MPTLVPSREAVAVALFNLVSVDSGNIPGLVTSSRQLRHYQDVDTSEMPALFIRQRPEHVERTYQGMKELPARRVMWFEIFVYTADPQEGSVLPITQLNGVVDAIEAALLPDATTGKQSLGGLTAVARINGQIEYAENLTNDGKSVAIVPIEVLRP